MHFNLRNEYVKDHDFFFDNSKKNFYKYELISNRI